MRPAHAQAGISARRPRPCASARAIACNSRLTWLRNASDRSARQARTTSISSAVKSTDASAIAARRCPVLGEEGEVDPEKGGGPDHAPGAQPVLAAFVFLHRLEADPQRLAQLLLAYPRKLSRNAQPLACIYVLLAAPPLARHASGWQKRDFQPFPLPSPNTVEPDRITVTVKKVCKRYMKSPPHQTSARAAARWPRRSRRAPARGSARAARRSSCGRRRRAG